jgi:hypothetical protein
MADPSLRRHGRDVFQIMHVCFKSSSAALWKNKEGLSRDSPSIVFAAAVALTGRPPQRRYESSHKAPAQDNETLDHLLSLLKDGVSLLANHSPSQAIFFG